MGISFLFWNTLYPFRIPICCNSCGDTLALEKCCLLQLSIAYSNSAFKFIVVHFCFVDNNPIVLFPCKVLLVAGSTWAVSFVNITLVWVEVIVTLITFLMFSKCLLVWICFHSVCITFVMSLHLVVLLVPFLVVNSYRNFFWCSIALCCIIFNWYFAFLHSILDSLVSRIINGRSSKVVWMVPVLSLFFLIPSLIYLQCSEIVGWEMSGVIFGTMVV